MEVTIKINKKSKQAKTVIEMLKTFDFVTFEEQPRYNKETEKAIKDVKAGRVFKVKNSKDLFKELGI